MSFDPSRNVLTIKTVQISPIRTVMTVLKDILIETNIVFGADGLRILNMDKTNTIVVHLHLRAEEFEFYECKREKIVIGVVMRQLFKLINSLDNSDTLTLYIDDDDYCDGVVSHLSLRFENGDLKKCRTHKLKLVDPEHDELELPDAVFSSIINLPSADFQKEIRDLAQLSDKLEIRSVGNELIYRCHGVYSESEFRRAESEAGGMEFVRKQDSSQIIQGRFSMKHLNHVIKGTPLCPQVELYFENDLPLVVKYSVASLGEMKLGLVPIPEETMV
jgi:proliferating cell nuclear antigen